MKLSLKRKYIFICTGKDCKKNGCKEVINASKDTIKQEKLNRSVKVIKTKCMDYCKKGPNAIVDNELYNKVKKDDVYLFLQDQMKK